MKKECNIDVSYLVYICNFHQCIIHYNIKNNLYNLIYNNIFDKKLLINNDYLLIF